MADRAERGDEQVYLFGSESVLCQPQRRKNDERRSDDQEEIAPGVEDPRRAAGHGAGRRDWASKGFAMPMARPAFHVRL